MKTNVKIILQAMAILLLLVVHLANLYLALKGNVFNTISLAIMSFIGLGTGVIYLFCKIPED